MEGLAGMSQHIRLPISLSSNGTFRTVAEDDPQEIAQNVLVILRTRTDLDGTGERLATPDFGIPDPAFTGFDAQEALDVVRTFEPRADVTVVQQALEDGVETTDLSVRPRRENI